MLARTSLILALSLLGWGCSGDVKEPGSDQAGGAGTYAGGGGTGGAAGSSASGGSTPLGGTGASMSGGAATGGGAGRAGTNGGESAGGEASGGGSSADALIVPEGLELVPHASGCGTLELQAVTLQRGAESLEMYVALKNTGDTAVCSPAFSANLIDASEQQVGTAIGGLLVRGFFRLKSDPSTTAACLAPGDVTMGALSDFPPEIELDDVSRVEYYCNLWRFDADPAGQLTIDDVKPVPRDNGVAYTGTLVNGLDISLATPGVSIFPLNAVGRPLGVTSARGTQAVPAGESWDFETDPVPDGGVDAAAYPTPTL